MKKRPLTLLVMLSIWLISQFASWVLNVWLDSNVYAENLSRATAILKQTLDYLASGPATGFVLGAAIFSIWDWPVVGQWIQKQRERFRNKEADEALANECEEISRYLYEQAARLERIRSEAHWQTSFGKSTDDVTKQWTEGRAAEAREEEQIRREIGHRVQSAFVLLNSRGIKMNLWAFSLSHYDLNSASYFFAELSDALKSGTYLEKEFKAGRFGGSLPARM